jgi:hypothetical protein
MITRQNGTSLKVYPRHQGLVYGYIWRSSMVIYIEVIERAFTLVGGVCGEMGALSQYLGPDLATRFGLGIRVY